MILKQSLRRFSMRKRYSLKDCSVIAPFSKFMGEELNKHNDSFLRSVSYGGIRYALQYYEMIEHFKLSSMNTKKRVLERINQITQDKTLNRSPQDVQEKFDALKMITNKDLDEVGDYIRYLYAAILDGWHMLTLDQVKEFDNYLERNINIKRGSGMFFELEKDVGKERSKIKMLKDYENMNIKDLNINREELDKHYQIKIDNINNTYTIVHLDTKISLVFTQIEEHNIDQIESILINLYKDGPDL